MNGDDYREGTLGEPNPYLKELRKRRATQAKEQSDRAMNKWKRERDSLDPGSLHYAVGGIEVIDILRAKLSPAEYRGFLRGNALKYLLRLGHKGEEPDHARDVEKAYIYLGWLVDAYDGERR